MGTSRHTPHRNWIGLDCQVRPIMQRNELEQFGNAILAALAAEWQMRALHGERLAYGMAHELEREVRRRGSEPLSARSAKPTARLLHLAFASRGLLRAN